MQTLRVNFGYFWPSFKKEDNYFTRALSKKYQVEISDDPELFFFTHPYNGRHDYLKYKCHRVFLGWENQRANWDIADYVLDSDYVADNPRHKRHPIWAGWQPERLTVPKNLDAFREKSKFCCMLVSNADAKERIDFFHELCKYKKVDSGGRYLNNIGYAVEDKLTFIKDYKFVISFENSSFTGYTTEKLVEPMFSNCIPIYWGNPRVGEDFNEASFISVKDRNDYQRAIEQILSLDKDEEQYLQMAAQPWFRNNKVPPEITSEALEEFLFFIVEDRKNKKPVATLWLRDKKHRFSLLAQRILALLKHRFQKGYL